MSKLSYRVTLVAGLAVFTFGGASVLAFGPTAQAEDSAPSATTTTTQSTSGDKSRDSSRVAEASQLEAAPKVEAEKKAKAEERQTDNKIKACQRNEARIDATMLRITTRGDRQLDVFTKIADRTEAFYVKRGKILSNYDALVADVNTKKAAALEAVAQIKASSTAFKCDGTNAKNEGAAFKTALKSEHAALKAYKTAVKNLIVGVKSVQAKTTEGAK